jgi:hypothetical protein
MNCSMPEQHLQDISPKENKARVEDMVRKQAAELTRLKAELNELASTHEEVCPDSMNEKITSDEHRINLNFMNE